ncbi:MAG: hypothetical protein ACI9VR_000874 [Cognaticolwellia sp.]
MGGQVVANAVEVALSGGASASKGAAESAERVGSVRSSIGDICGDLRSDDHELGGMLEHLAERVGARKSPSERLESHKAELEEGCWPQPHADRQRAGASSPLPADQSRLSAQHGHAGQPLGGSGRRSALPSGLPGTQLSRAQYLGRAGPAGLRTNRGVRGPQRRQTTDPVAWCKKPSQWPPTGSWPQRTRSTRCSIPTSKGPCLSKTWPQVA